MTTNADLGIGRYCLGCRAVLRRPLTAEDRWGIMQPPPPGFRAEAVECSRCGVLDVFLVADLPPNDGSRP